MRWPERLVHRAFLVAIVLKGIDGMVEIAGGSALLSTSRAALLQLVRRLTRGELLEDPGDFVATHLLHLAQHVSGRTEHFAALYLVVHGVIKVGLVAGLLRGALWSYPAALVLLSLFLVYQGVRLAQTHSLLLAGLTVLDLAIIGLIWLEWRHHRRRAAPRAPAA